jgi:hypothetical protein
MKSPIHANLSMNPLRRGVEMKGIIVWIVFLFMVLAVGLTNATARFDCTEPIPELFRRVSPDLLREIGGPERAYLR